jgi:hypothetical protein
MAQQTMEPLAETSPAPYRPERRRSARHALGWVSVVRQEPDGEGERWLAEVRDLSATGIGLELPGLLPAGSTLAVSPLRGKDGRVLLARAVNYRPAGGGRFYGCELLEPLGEADLRAWLA